MDMSPRVDSKFERRLRDTYRIFNRQLAARIRPHGVTIGQWHFLRALWEKQGLSQRELSELVGMREPTTATTIQGMERAGLVRRERDQDDVRRIKVYLTERGVELEAQLASYVPEVIGLAIAGLEHNEVNALNTALGKTAENLIESVKS